MSHVDICPLCDNRGWTSEPVLTGPVVRCVCVPADRFAGRCPHCQLVLDKGYGYTPHDTCPGCDGVLQPSNALCASCHQRPGALAWSATGIIGMTHVPIVMWCEVCVVTKQLEHARQQAARVEELEKRLAELESAT